MFFQECPKPVRTKGHGGLRHVWEGYTKFEELGAAELEEDGWVWLKSPALPWAKGEELAAIAISVFVVADFHFVFAVPAWGKDRERGSVRIRQEVEREEGSDGRNRNAILGGMMR